MIDTQAELVRIVEYLAKNNPQLMFMGVMLNGATGFVSFSVN